MLKCLNPTVVTFSSVIPVSPVIPVEYTGTMVGHLQWCKSCLTPPSAHPLVASFCSLLSLAGWVYWVCSPSPHDSDWTDRNTWLSGAANIMIHLLTIIDYIFVAIIKQMSEVKTTLKKKKEQKISFLCISLQVPTWKSKEHTHVLSETGHSDPD